MIGEHMNRAVQCRQFVAGVTTAVDASCDRTRLSLYGSDTDVQI